MTDDREDRKDDESRPDGAPPFAEASDGALRSLGEGGPPGERPRDGDEAVGDHVEEKPAEERPAEERPVDGKSVDEKPVEEKPVSDKPADDRPADDGPADEKPAEEKAAGDQMDEKPADEKPADEKPDDEASAAAKPAAAKPADEKPAGEKTTDEKPTDKEPAEAKAVDAGPADAKPTDEESADAKPAGEASAAAKPAAAKPADEKATDEKATDAKPTDEEPAEAKAVDAGPADAPAERKGMPDWLRFPLVLGIVGAVSAASLTGIYAVTRKQIEESKKVKVVKAFESVLGKGARKPEEAGDAGKGGYFVFRDGGGAPVAYAAQVACPGSYNTGEPVQLIVVLDAKLEKLLGARVIESKETPGLGERVKEPPSAISIAGSIAGREPRRRVVLKKQGGALVGEVTEKDGSVVVTSAGGGQQSFPRGEVEVTDAPFPAAFLDQFTGIPVAEAGLRAAGGRVDAITGATVSSTAVTRGVEEAAKLLKEALKK